MSDSRPVAIVAGVGPGTGAALARRFHADGYQVALLARDIRFAADLARDLGEAEAYACDIRDATSVEDAIAAIRAEMGEVSVLLYNAGAGAFGDVLAITPEQFETTWRVMVLGALLLAQAVIPAMRAAGEGAIIFTGANPSLPGSTRAIAYDSANNAQRALAESMAHTLWPLGIHVALMIVDGVVDMPRTRKMLPDKPDDFFVTPDEIAQAAADLVAQERFGWSLEVDVRSEADARARAETAEQADVEPYDEIEEANRAEASEDDEGEREAVPEARQAEPEARPRGTPVAARPRARLVRRPMKAPEPGMVVAVCRSREHRFSKEQRDSINLLAGLGVEGDAHAGETVQHLYRIKLDPTAPNRAQVHFLHAELFDELADQGFVITPGAMGENVLTRGLDLLAMPTGTLFRIGEALVEISGIRDPCKKIDQLGNGLTKALFARDADGGLVRKAGIMGIVLEGGRVRPGDTIEVTLPPEPHRPLEVV